MCSPVHSRSPPLLLFLLGFLLLLTPLAFSQPETYHLKLLAVQENHNGYTGSGADLFLELKEGSGRVFLETQPLTKMDTQFSTRFAKEIACAQYDLPCGRYDFIYTIRAESNIIGGPSAGAAIAALTAIALLDLPYDKQTTITGTINSGGIVGPVGGAKAKLDAAKGSGVQKVLIAAGAGNAQEEGQDIDLIAYGKSLGLEVKEAADLDEVIFEIAGADLNHKNIDIAENDAYREIMQGLQQLLCERTEKIQQELDERNIIVSDELIEAARQREERAHNATAAGDFYSAASFCFGSNIQLKSEYYKQELAPEAAPGLFIVLEKKIGTAAQKASAEPIEAISDLQALMVVQERLEDARSNIRQFREEEAALTAEEVATLLAYAEERYFSALSWMQFFEMEGKKLVIDQERLEHSCREKITEAEERQQYAGLFLNAVHLEGISQKIGDAQDAENNGEFPLCLITAAQAKADANAILSSLGLTGESVSRFVDSKAKAVERVIAENTAEGIFPILGFSYYQYANTLKGNEPFTALVYLEYALEMSDLSIYFPVEEERALPGFPALRELPLPPLPAYILAIGREWWFLLLGMIIGLAAGLSLRKNRKNIRRKKKAGIVR